MMRWGKLHRDAEAILAELGVSIDVRTAARGLTLAAQQSVEIAKAISLNVRVLIMDEPTASLSAHEVAQLFRLVRELRAKGVAILFVSHRMEEVFEMLGQSPRSVKCPAIDGIIEEANEVTGEVAEDNVRDAAIIAAGQAVEHYEITRYGSLIAWAQELGHDDCASVLKQTLEEEKAADQKLTSMALGKINAQVAAA